MAGVIDGGLGASGQGGAIRLVEPAIKVVRSAAASDKRMDTCAPVEVGRAIGSFVPIASARGVACRGRPLPAG